MILRLKLFCYIGDAISCRPRNCLLVGNPANIRWTGPPSQKNHCCEWNDLFSQKLAVKFSSDEKRKGKKYKLSIFSSPRFSILPAKTIWGWNAISENISDLVLAVFLRHVYQSSWWVSILDIGSARRCPSFKAGYFLTAAFSARIPKSLTSLHEQWASNSSTSKVFHCFGLFGIYNLSWQIYHWRRV